MSIISAFEVASGSPCAPRKNLLWRIVDCFVAAGQARADEEMKRHSHLLPTELDQVTWKLNARSEDSLPFVR